MELDRVPLWRGDHVAVKQLVEDFAKYLYLPRLAEPSVLVEAVRQGVALLTWEHEGFAYADSFDEEVGRFRGLRGGEQVAISGADAPGLLVKSKVAAKQMGEDEAKARATAVSPGEPGESGTTGGTPRSGEGREPGGAPSGPLPPAPQPKRWYGTVELSNPMRLGSDAGKIAEEVISHLAGLPGAKVKVTLEIEAALPEGVPDHVVRIVTENGRTLKFREQGFETE
jgi:hypothetical protein